MAFALLRAKWSHIIKFKGEEQLWECLKILLDATKKKFNDGMVTEVL